MDVSVRYETAGLLWARNRIGGIVAALPEDVDYVTVLQWCC